MLCTTPTRWVGFPNVLVHNNTICREKCHHTVHNILTPTWSLTPKYRALSEQCIQIHFLKSWFNPSVVRLQDPHSMQTHYHETASVIWINDCLRCFFLWIIMLCPRHFILLKMFEFCYHSHKHFLITKHFNDKSAN